MQEDGLSTVGIVLKPNEIHYNEKLLQNAKAS